MRSARQAQPDADNGNGFLLAALHFIQLGTHLPQLQDGTFKRRKLFLYFLSLTHDSVISSSAPIPPGAMIRLRLRTFLEALPDPSDLTQRCSRMSSGPRNRDAKRLLPDSG